MNEKDKGITVEEIVGESQKKETQVIAFKLSSELIGIPIKKVIEITINRNITPVPKSPDYIIGVMNLRGKIVPVADLRKYMGIYKEKETGETIEENSVVIVESHKGEVGIAVDKVVGSIRFYEENLLPEPIGNVGIDTEYISGVVKMDRELLIVLNIDAMFN